MLPSFRETFNLSEQTTPTPNSTSTTSSTPVTTPSLGATSATARNNMFSFPPPPPPLPPAQIQQMQMQQMQQMQQLQQMQHQQQLPPTTSPVYPIQFQRRDNTINEYPYLLQASTAAPMMPATLMTTPAAAAAAAAAAPPPPRIQSMSNVNQLVYNISQRAPVPPYSTLKPSTESLQVQRPKRSKRRSKFTQEQDDTITSMKRQGKSWIEIAEAAKVSSYLAARNRYQVLIGQQGGGTSECGPEEVRELQSILDEAELEKLKYICKEFKKSTGRSIDAKDIRELLRMLFWKDPLQFDVNASYLIELERLQQQRFDEFGGNDREISDHDSDANHIK